MRIILCFLLTLVAAPAWAEWVKVGVANDGRFTFYIDPDSIRKDGNLRKVWEIQDRRQRDKDGVMSWRARSEYDCKEEQTRILALSKHSEPMAGGETLWSRHGDAGEWSDIPPGSIVESALKRVCAK